MHYGDVRGAARWTIAIARRSGQAVRLLPPRIAFFYVGALALAVLTRDRFSLISATRPEDLEKLLRLAANASAIAEIGTGTGWAAIALALADRRRHVTSFDVEPRNAPRYARLVPRSVRERVEFVLASGAEAAQNASAVDFVFIDSSHELEETVETFEAWRPKLTSGGVVAFHDYGDPLYPGVEQAVAQLGLAGRADGDVYIWRS
jgi:predicted O-methyltransferase YrrM